jgi:hypothetical protein
LTLPLFGDRRYYIAAAGYGSNTGPIPADREQMAPRRRIRRS